MAEEVQSKMDKYYDAINRENKLYREEMKFYTSTANEWGAEIFKKLILLNGGAIVLLPTILNLLPEKHNIISQLSMSFYSFVLGLLCGFLVAVSGYFNFGAHGGLAVQRLDRMYKMTFFRFYPEHEDKTQLDVIDKQEKKESCYITYSYYSGIIFTFLSVVFFVCGCFLALKVF